MPIIVFCYLDELFTALGICRAIRNGVGTGAVQKAQNAVAVIIRARSIPRLFAHHGLDSREREQMAPGVKLKINLIRGDGARE